MEKEAINHSSFAFLIDFKGLYLAGERKETNPLPGIPLAHSSNRVLIQQHQQS
jgi:uncharacterized membrane protein YfbV (UPF0208 family)